MTRFFPHTFLGSSATDLSSRSHWGALLGCLLIASPVLAQTNGPLRVHPDNPRYFTDNSGQPLLLTGSHTWPNLVDMGPADPPPPFDFDAYLAWLKRYGHNFTRGWTWEPTSWDTSTMKNEAWRNGNHVVTPHPWQRTGPGLALDGKPKFDLDKWNPDYLDRIQTRLAKAQNAGVFMSVMLFEGFAVQFQRDAWSHHPFNPANNINGLDGDTNGDGKGIEIHQLANQRVTKIQEAYLRWLVTGLNRFDNLLYEVSNETHPGSTEWQYHVIRHVKEIEAALPKQHPVGMTYQNRRGKNETLFNSPADWVSPNSEGGFKDTPPDMAGAKVVLSDTDHLWGIGGDASWVWKSVTRGLNPIFMDTYDGRVLGTIRPQDEGPRRAMGRALEYSRRMNLGRATPRNELCSTTYCLAEPGMTYLAFAPEGSGFELDLTAGKGPFSVEWCDPASGEVTKAGTVAGGTRHTFTAPFSGGAVLFLDRVSLHSSHPVKPLRPNVVVLLSDDLGWKDIGCYGGPVRTPALDALAARGTRFTDFYSGCAVCSPSRATLLTGRHHIRTGIYSWIEDSAQRSHLLEREITLAELLQQQGYATAHVGKWHLGLPTEEHQKPTPSAHGFDYWFATANNAAPSHLNPTNFLRNGDPVGRIEGYSCQIVVDEAIAWLDRQRAKGRPFLLNVWFHEPHAPIAAPEDIVSGYGEVKDQAAIYSGTIENTDRAIARLLAKLEQVAPPEDTLILYASDNGSYRRDRVGHLRGRKGTNWEGGIRVPGIVSWPDRIPAGRVEPTPAGLVDVLPTVCGLLGLESPPGVHLDGSDLAPLLVPGTGRAFTRHQPLFWHLQKSHPIVALRDGRWSLTADPDYELPTDNLFRETWIPLIKSGGYTHWQLFDLETDPSQTNNLAGTQPEVLARLTAELLKINADIMRDAPDWQAP